MSLRRVYRQAARDLRRMLAVSVGAALLVVLVAGPGTAKAHEVGRDECRTYQSMHHLITGSKRLAAYWGRQCRIAAAAHVLTHPLPDAAVPAILRRIRGCESGSGPTSPPRYRAQNPTSTASGAYQALDTTWGGHLGYARALEAPPRVQDRWAIRHWSRYGTAPWAASRGCWG